MPSIKAPAPGEQPSQLQQQASLYGRMASMLLPGMREFLAASLNPDPDQRASAAELLKLPIMTSAMMVLPAQVGLVGLYFLCGWWGHCGSTLGAGCVLTKVHALLWERANCVLCKDKAVRRVFPCRRCRGCSQRRRR